MRFFLFPFILALIISVSAVNAQQINEDQKMNHWVDSVYNSLTVEQRVAQLIFVRANYSGQPYLKSSGKYIRKYNLGGVCFFGSDPMAQAKQFNAWNKFAKTPLMSTIDAEWGLGMRLKGTLKYPLQMTLGAVQDDSLIYEMGRQIGEQCRRMGIHINFAPVVDVNSNPRNPVIGMRSFGENPEEVGIKGSLYMHGLQDENIVACAKHFPGHGDTWQDSHKTLPVVNAPFDKIEREGLVPFAKLIDEGVNSIMIAHLSVPALDSLTNHPATLSEPIVTGLLKEKMGYGGLIVTDGLDMKGVTNNYGNDSVSYLSFVAGNDLLLIPDDVPSAIKTISDGIKHGDIPEARLEESCKKILKYKYLTDAWKREMVDIKGLQNDLRQPAYRALSNKLFSDAITLVKNEGDMIPLRNNNAKTMLLVIGETSTTTFEKSLTGFKADKVFHLVHNASSKDINWVLKQARHYDRAIVALLNTNILAGRQFGITNSEIKLVDSLATLTNVVLDVFASPYALDFFKQLDRIPVIIVSYQDKPICQLASANVLVGKQNPTGRLPVSIAGFSAGTGISNLHTTMDDVKPKMLGIDTEILKRIDSTALNGIEIGAFPGCQILAAKDGHIFYDKTFGYQTYDKQVKVEKDDVYDLASLTKILVTTISLMKLEEQGRIDLNKKMVTYLPMLKGTNKEDLKFREVMAHQAGLMGWIPYYDSTIREYGPDTAIFHTSISEGYPTRVANRMYIQKHYSNEIYRELLESPMSEEKVYKYSDLGFYLFRTMIESITNRPLEEYVQEKFYRSMGLNYLTYLPREKFPLNKIAPTEDDTVFRKQVLRGDVHDQGAAMLGGVSGHAGLFGNSRDVAVIMQMLLNGGVYNGVQYLKPETVKMFTSYQFPQMDNRRGLGFDKPLLEFEEHRTNCESTSPSSFGHSGFTGTYTWADPENGLVYVFISNRVYPDMHNSKISELDFRTNIHQLFYDAIGDGK
jgi:beta-glucosidase-like glycosyl hydrolase/CubicO group peptidase (beta-lactamase class C family)